MNHLWLLLCYDSRVSSCNTNHMACKAENIYRMILYRKNLPTPGIVIFLFCKHISTYGNSAL